MASAPYSYGYSDRGSPRRRAVAVLLALAANLLLLAMLLGIAPFVPRKLVDRVTTVQLLPEPPPSPTHARSAVKRKPPAGGAPPRATKAAAAPRPAEPTGPLQMMIVSKEVFAASDISKLPSHASEAAAGGGNGNGTDTGKGSADGKGDGPGGEHLYNADWYSRPTNAELSPYLPHNAPRTGWGEIACKTVPNYRVEDCVEIGDSPMGSGFGRAVREAAWQFRVRPPRIGGKALVGSWVRIRIDYTETGADAR